MDPELKINKIMGESFGRRTLRECLDGRYVGSRSFKGKPKNIAFDATIRASALNQKHRKGDLAINIDLADVKEKVLERKTSNTILFLTDSSGSMGVKKRMSAVKGIILSLLIDAYQKRDKVGLIVFREKYAELLLNPTSNFNLFLSMIEEIPTGGRTPLPGGLLLAHKVLARDKNQNKDGNQLLVIISDGKANVSISNEKPFEDVKKIARTIKKSKMPSIVIDSEVGFIRLGFAKKLAQELDAKYMPLDDLSKALS